MLGGKPGAPAMHLAEMAGAYAGQGSKPLNEFGKVNTYS